MKVLVMCFGNTCRSSMTAALVQRQIDQSGRFGEVVVESAGYGECAAGGNPAAPEWTALSRETGIDLSAHTSRWIDEIADLGQYDKFVCVDAKAADSLRARGVAEESVLVIDVPNPYQEGRPLEDGVPVYREAFYAISRDVVPQIVVWLH